MSFKGHRVTLFLSRELEMGLTDLRSQLKLGQSFAGLLCFVEGLHGLGFLSDDVYEKYRERYSTPLLVEKSDGKAELAIMQTRFSTAIKNWKTMPDKARHWYIQKAEEYKDRVKNADIILALSSKEPVELMSHG